MKRINKIIFEYDDYKESTQEYNRWFVKVRYFASASLFASVLALKFIFNIKPSAEQIISGAAVSAIILLYNLYFDKIIKKDPKGDLHKPITLSSLQMFLDLAFLSVIIYFYGGIESPLFLLYLVHLIIASLIFPPSAVYGIILVLSIVLAGLSYMEFHNIIPHQKLEGLYSKDLYNDQQYVLTFLGVFVFLMIATVYAAQKISKELYARERKLKKAYEDLIEAEKSKQKYILAVVHELKSPIAAAKSYLDLFLQKIIKLNSSEAEDKLKRTNVRLDDSISIINNILNAAKLSLSNEIAFKTIDINDALNKAIYMYSPIIENKNIKLTFNNKSVQSLILGDEKLLALVFSNILGNAVKYSHENGNIQIDVFDDLDIVRVEISDDGIGIPEKDLPNLFKELYRASNAKKYAVEGAGFGLSTVKRIIDKHRGSIEIISPSKLGNEKSPGVQAVIKLLKDPR